jgi:site-specific DNA-methyltransferase (adenine-specific)
VWSYRTGGASKKRWARKHDILLFYSKSSVWTFEPQMERSYMMHKYGFKKSDFKIDPDTGQQYSLVLGRDVWDIPSVGSDTAERLGYPTQKPLALLDRIIKASCPEGGVLLDPFCGCGTAVDAAQELGRKWIGIDITYIAIDLIIKRLQHRYGKEILDKFTTDGIPQDMEGARALFARNAFDFERWAVSLVDGQPNAKQVGDKGSDGKIRFYNTAEEFGVVHVSVKGGRQVNPAMLRDLRGTVEREGAEMGILITLTEPTRGIREEAAKSGTFKMALTGQTYPKIQVITVADLMSGKRPLMPTAILPYLKAQPRAMDQDQLPLDSN